MEIQSFKGVDLVSGEGRGTVTFDCTRDLRRILCERYSVNPGDRRVLLWWRGRQN